jgi:hypothetical protein
MSEERDRARLIAAYADDLIGRRVSERPETEAASEGDVSRMLDLTRALSEIEFEAPQDLSAQLWQRARDENIVPEPVSQTRTFWRSLTALRAAVRAAVTWPLDHPTATALIVSILLVALVGKRPPMVSAAELLTTSTRAEASRLERPGLIGRRAFVVETRRLPDATLIARRHVEQWVNPKAHVKVRRVFDDAHRLLAGEWTHPDGSRIVYQPNRPPQTERALEAKPLTLDAMWRWEPSAADFTQLVGRIDQVGARKTDDGFQLSFDDANGRLTRAELALDKDRLPVAQRIVLREGRDSIEVRSQRQAAEEVPESRVANASFEPEAELLPASSPDVTAPKSVASAPLASVARPLLSAIAVTGIELEATYRLHRLGDCLAEAGVLHPDPNRFRIRVVVGSEACRVDAQREFASLAQTPGVSVALAVVQSARGGERSQAESRSSADVPSDEALATMPVHHVLYDFYARQALREAQSGHDIDETVRPLIRRLVVWTRDRSSQVVRYARELERLTARWPPETLKPLGLDASSKWQALVRDNARGLTVDTELLLVQVEPAFGVPSSDDVSVAPLRSVTDVRHAIGDLQALVEANDAAIRELFSPVNRGDLLRPTPDLTKLVRDIRRAGRLAERLTEPWALDP